MSIQFNKIRWRNLLSTGNQFTEIHLDRATTTLIVGDNGAGKSTILDALCFGLFNKPFRNINKPQLLNSINQKQLVVEVEFSIGTKQYKVVRGIKPTIFEIHLNGELLNQDAASRDYQRYLEDHVLKLNYKSFTQIVILGSASFTPFMQLPAAHRREIIEDLLDIKIFSTMNDLLKEKYNDIRQGIQQLEDSIDLAKQKAQLQQDYIKTLEEDKERQRQSIEQEIEKYREEIIGLQDQIEQDVMKVTELEDSIKDKTTVKKRESELNILEHKLEDKKKTLEKNLKFYHDNDTCPTCQQDIEQSFIEKHISCHNEKLGEIELALLSVREKQNANRTRREEIDSVLALIYTYQQKVISNQTSVAHLRKWIDTQNRLIKDTLTDTGNIDEEKTKLKAFAKIIVEETEKKTKLQEEKIYYEMAGVLLKDTGIKTKIIKQYLPVINKLINKYLHAMDFFVSFEIDESFTEVIKSRHRDEYTYASFSEGEKARIDLALLFTWRAIARMKNSTNTNLLILDEVFDGSLDINGTDFVMNILNTVGDNNNIFIISHKSALFDKFRSVIEFEKHQNYSQIKQRGGNDNT